MNINKTDIQLKTDIETELRWDPRLNAAQIGVTVDQGAVSLLGAVDTYAEKWAAEEAAKRVSGVRTLALDLTVKLLAEHKRSDTEIATAIQSAGLSRLDERSSTERAMASWLWLLASWSIPYPWVRRPSRRRGNR